MADATPTYCSAGSPHADGLSVSDVTFRGANAADCFGVQSGNDVANPGAFIGWNGYQLLLSDESAIAGGVSASWMGINWGLSGAANAKNGGYTVSWSDPAPVNLPLALDLVVVTKGSNRFASYLFTDELFSSPGSSTGTWKVSYKANGNQIPNLGHLSIWARVAPLPHAAVAEPGTLSLLALGLAAIGVTVRRREAAAAC